MCLFVCGASDLHFNHSLKFYFASAILAYEAVTYGYGQEVPTLRGLKHMILILMEIWIIKFNVRVIFLNMMFELDSLTF